MLIRTATIFSAVTVASIAPIANGGIIELTYSGVATTQVTAAQGTFTYTNLGFSLTALSDTSLVQSYSTSGGSGFYALVTSATMTVGATTFDITSPLLVAVNNTLGISGLGDPAAGDLFIFGDSDFSSWDLQSNVGPLNGTATPGASFETTLGTIQFIGDFPITFSANVVPAPGAIALLGLAGLAGRRRR
ncbi:MAG: hypothetical protein RL591_1281 [Planctomycetota bacterium]